MPPPGQTARADSKFIVFENFKKLNTQEVRQGLSEAEFNWVENLQPLADNNWDTVPGLGSTLVSIAQTISTISYGSLLNQGVLLDLAIAFTTVGSAWAINIATGATFKFAPDGTFSVPGQVVNGFVSQGPDMAAWENYRFLFNDVISGYCSWDGNIFSHQGGVSPQITITNPGSGYTSAPSVTISGGSGSGATAVATINPPQVAQVILAAPNFGGAGYSTAPAVIFTPPGATAVATVDQRAVLTLNFSPPTATGEYVIGHGGATPPYLIAVSFSGGGGSGAAAVCTTAVNAAGHVFIQSLTLTAGGSGYSSAPTVVFTPSPVWWTGLGGPAVAVTTVGNGAITGIAVTSGGSYNSAPAVSFSGGSPSVTASAVAVLGGGGVATITLTNPGINYLPGDTLTVSFAGGGGSGAAASAHVAPAIPKGTSVAVFQGRVWLNFFTGSNSTGPLNGLQWSGVNGWDDWNVGNASSALILPDTDLVHQITGVRSFNNFLWIIGDQSIKQIGNISLNQAGNVTLFTIITLSSDQGTVYLRSCVSFNRVFFFVNQNGVYAVFGSSVQKVSGDLDGIFQNAVFPPTAGGLQPQAALVDMQNVHCVMWLLKYNDTQFSLSVRSLFVVFDGKRWFPASNGDGIIALAGTCTLASPNWVPFVSFGNDAIPAFNNKNTPVLFRARTALSHHGNPVQRKKTLRLGYAMTLGVGPGAVNISVDSDENRALLVNPTLQSGFQTRTVADPNISGTYLGFTIAASLANYTLTNLRIEYQETNIGNQN